MRTCRVRREIAAIRKRGGVKLECGRCIVGANSSHMRKIYNEIGKEIVEEIIESIRKEVEQCQCIPTSVRIVKKNGKRSKV
jgi:hypothetical protein